MSGINYGHDIWSGPVKDWHKWEEDFDFYLATNYVITETGSGSRAISQAKDGLLLITNAAGGSDANFLQLRDLASGQVAEHWKFVSGTPMYFGCRFKTSDATLTSIIFGLQITDTTPLAVSDGIYFRKDTAAKLVKLVACKGSTESTVSGALTTSGFLADNTFTTLEFYYDGSFAGIQAFQDGVAFGSVPLTNIPDTEELTISFGIQNGEAVAKTLTVDWLEVRQKRTSP